MLLAQQARGFFDQAQGDQVAGLKKELPADDLRARVDVNLVCQAVERVVLARIGEVEDVLGNDANLADARAGGFELGERGHRIRRSFLRMPRLSGRGERDQASEKANLN